MCKMHGENSLKLAWAGDTSSGSFTSAYPASCPLLAQKRRDLGTPFAGTRAALDCMTTTASEPSRVNSICL